MLCPGTNWRAFNKIVGMMRGMEEKIYGENLMGYIHVYIYKFWHPDNELGHILKWSWKPRTHSVLK